MEETQHSTITPVRGAGSGAPTAISRTSDRATALAIEARRRGLLTALSQVGAMLTFARLNTLMIGKYADELAVLTVEQLTEPIPRSPLLPRPNESIEDAVMRVFKGRPQRQLSSAFFVHHMGLKRWTAQSLLADLAERGLLIRDGKTSGTRYRLADERADISTDDE